MDNIARYRLEHAQQIQKVKDALQEAFLGPEPDSAEGRLFFENEIFRRYNQSLTHAVPWVARQIDLAGKEIIDIGCGSGSSTAAFAHFAGQVYGYDINDVVLNGARARARALGQENVSFTCVDPTALPAVLKQNHPQGVDVVLLFAVLEHCTPLECLETLQVSWSLLRPGGCLVVVETPNRFTYFDSHTSLLPFFNLLPPEIGVRYYRNSPRSEFIEVMDRAMALSEPDGRMELARQGKGVSYHEFQLALQEPDLGKLLVADGYEPEMLAWIPISFEETLLQTYFLNRPMGDIPIGFARAVLNLIFRKPLDPAHPVPPQERLTAHRRMAHLTNYLDLQTSFVKTRQLDTLPGLARFLAGGFLRRVKRRLGK